MIRQNIAYKRLNTLVNITADLVVVGGGLSGVCCAISAARQGIDVVLLQDRPVLGGNASSEIRVWALGATSHMGNNNRWAREGGIIDEIMVENLHRNKEGNPFFFDMLLMDKVLAEPNITLLLNTVVYDVFKDGNKKISSILAFNPQCATTYSVVASLFADASGDGIVGFLSGASFRFGAEDSVEFHEGFTPKENYGQLLGHTILFYTKKTDKPVKYVAPQFAMKDIKVLPKYCQIRPDQNGCNYWWFEYGGNMNTVTDTEKIKYELWRIVYGAWNYIKNSGNFPESENMTLEWVGVVPGKRESRRFEGLYMLTQHDIIRQQIFDDAVAYGGWAIDLHPAEGVYSPLSSCSQYHSKGVYEIPYRCYVSKDIENLFMLGRIISVSHVALGSTRVMITCALGGQAIGVAAAMCAESKCLPRDLLETDRMHELQQRLSYNGQSIPDIAIDQEQNIAHSAKIEVDSTLSLSVLPFNGEWQELLFSRGMLLPLRAATGYQFDVWLAVTEPTRLVVDWMSSSIPSNYTPDVLIEQVKIDLKPGKQKVHIPFTKSMTNSQYAFIIFRSNKSVSIGLSDNRLTGALSVCNKINLAVNNHGRQEPPANSGFESFEFFTPERRPGGKNLALEITPAIDCFGKENVVNGLIRPHIAPNAWVATWDSPKATMKLNWSEQKSMHSIRLFFDTDYDHPMETIQWNHPESQIPFCVSQFAVFDDRDRCLYSTEENYKTICDIEFAEPVSTSSLRLEFLRNSPYYPISLFEIEVR